MARQGYHINPAGYREVLRDRSTQQECLGIAQLFAFQAQASSGGARTYTCDVIPGVNRAHARATTVSEGAAWQELRYHHLQQAVPRRGQWSAKRQEKWRERDARRRNR